MQTLQKYSMVAAEHLNKLLGDEPLATKAKRMSEELYAPTSRSQGSEGSLSAGISTSL